MFHGEGEEVYFHTLGPLDVESQQVVLWQTESADWDFIIDAGVRSVPIVAVQPARQLDPALSRVAIGLSIGPFAQAGLDESLGLSIGLWRVGLGPDVTEPEPLAGFAEGEGFIAGAVIGHDALDFDAEAFVVGERGLEKGDGAALLLVGHDLGESDAGVIVDGDMDELPADTSAVALAFAVAGDAMADFVETAELFDVDVDHLARLGPLVAADGGGRFQGVDPAQTQALGDAAYGRRRGARRGRALLAGAAGATQRFDLRDNCLRRRPGQTMRPRATT